MKKPDKGKVDTRRPASAAPSRATPSFGSGTLAQIGAQLAQRPHTVIPFIILFGVTTGLVVLFAMLVWPYLLSLIAAVVTALMLYPLQLRLRAWFRGSSHLAAAVITILIVLTVVVPAAAVVTIGVREFEDGVNFVQKMIQQNDSRIRDFLQQFDERFHVSPEELKTRAEEGGRMLMGLAFRWGQNILGGAVGLAIQIVIYIAALYFFLADGERILAAWDALTPLDIEHDRTMRSEFSKVCRGAILGTVVAAVAQGIVMAIGLGVIEMFAGIGLGKWIFLLGGLTSVVAIIPLIGTAGVWLPLSVIAFAYGHTAAAVAIAVWGFLVVGSIDNLIKIVVIKDTANMHPLLVLISVFGGLELFGLLGVFLGPAIAGVVFAMLKVLRKELTRLIDSQGEVGERRQELASSN